MAQITVDADDVEALVQQAGLTIHVRNIVDVHKDDPAVIRTAPNVVSAVQRLNRAVNESRRVESPEEREPLTESAREMIERIVALPHNQELDGYIIDLASLDQDVRIDMPGFLELRNKRCVQICNLSIVAQWKDRERRATDQIRMLVRFTAKGDAEWRNGRSDDPQLLVKSDA